MKMPKTTGEVRCTVHLTERRAFSFAAPVAWVRVSDVHAVRHKNGDGYATATVRAGLTLRARLLVVALRVLAALGARVDVNVGA